MSVLKSFVSVSVFSSFALTVAAGCSSNVDGPEEVVAPVEPSVAPQAITTGSTDGAGTTTGTVVEKPRCDQACVYNGCMSTCRKDHISNGWCDAYCFCRAVIRGSASDCSSVASDSFIDI